MPRLVTMILGGALGAGLGAALGVLTHAALRPNAAILFGCAVGMTVSVLLRRLPHRQESALETLGRLLIGALLGGGMVGALVGRLAGQRLPFVLAPMPADTRLLEHPVLVGLGVGALTGLVLGHLREPAPKPAAGAPKATPAAPPPAEPGAPGRA